MSESISSYTHLNHKFLWKSTRLFLYSLDGCRDSYFCHYPLKFDQVREDQKVHCIDVDLDSFLLSSPKSLTLLMALVSRGITSSECMHYHYHNLTLLPAADLP